MFLSQASKYALQAILFMAQQPTESKQSKEIAEALRIPRHFLAKILQDLSKRGLLQSSKGPGGGFKLAQPADETRLIDVVQAIEGNRFGAGCALGLPECSETDPCPLHNQWAGIKDGIFSMLSDKSVRELLSETPNFRHRIPV
ncbi:MAG: Rrf2 family transcriptional regulator [Candidatus Hydrogenedentes bacterium]|nr:Rrf2 family transcriptional regulator [Candidatus Hydrogenedentota bacterium]